MAFLLPALAVYIELETNNRERWIHKIWQNKSHYSIIQKKNEQSSMFPVPSTYQ